MRPRTRYVPSLDVLPTRLAPCTIPCYSTAIDVSSIPSTDTICTDSVATTTVDPTLMAPPTSVSG